MSDIIYASADTNIIDKKTKIPSKIGFGISYQFKNKLILALDYQNQNWSKAEISGRKSPFFTNSNNYNFGLQYLPNAKSTKNYLARIRYRMGGYYSQTPIRIEGTQVNDYGITGGLGLPFKNTNSMFNFSVEAGVRGEVTESLIEEKYLKLNFNISFYDFWFYKPKFD